MKKTKTINTTITGNSITIVPSEQGKIYSGVETYIENERKLVTYNPETKNLQLATSPKNIMIYFSREEERVVRVKTQTGDILEYRHPETINILREGKQVLTIDSENYFTSVPQSLKQKIKNHFPN